VRRSAYRPVQRLVIRVPVERRRHEDVVGTVLVDLGRDPTLELVLVLGDGAVGNAQPDQVRRRHAEDPARLGDLGGAHPGEIESGSGRDVGARPVGRDDHAHRRAGGAFARDERPASERLVVGVGCEHDARADGLFLGDVDAAGEDGAAPEREVPALERHARVGEHAPEHRAAVQGGRAPNWPLPLRHRTERARPR